MALVVCGACQCHVKRADSVCPFCGASMPMGFSPGLGEALLLGMGLAVALDAGTGIVQTAHVAAGRRGRRRSRLHPRR
jgi:hypothetical protein